MGSEPGYVIGRSRRTGLTKREREVLEQLRRTKRNQTEIADKLGLTRQRVNAIVGSLKRKGYLDDDT